MPAVSRPNAPEPRRFRRVRSWTPVCWKAGGGAEGNRTPDLRIANNQANPSRCFPNMIFPPIFRCLALSRRMFSFLNVPATSMHDFTGITHGAGPAKFSGRPTAFGCVADVPSDNVRSTPHSRTFSGLAVRSASDSGCVKTNFEVQRRKINSRSLHSQQ